MSEKEISLRDAIVKAFENGLPIKDIDTAKAIIDKVFGDYNLKHQNEIDKIHKVMEDFHSRFFKF